MLSGREQNRLRAAAAALVDQKRARVIVEPYADASGYWFGGGNMVEAGDGTLYLVGRYRNAGDSRTGLAKGARGLELAVFRSADRGESFEKVLSFGKQDLSSGGREVLSIEGAALNLTADGVELYVSTEKDGIGYPPGIESFQKPGTGVWTIDLLTAPAVERLDGSQIRPFLGSDDPEYLHVKDPVVHTTSAGDTVLVFCSHPFSWSSSNSGYCVRPAGKKRFTEPVFDFFRRGTTWDVAVSRITDLLTVPGEIAGADGAVDLVFYDGAECIREHEQNPNAVRRPRGYSCEEIAGLAACPEGRIESLRRISTMQPQFVSPYGTGSSRYIHACPTADGVYALWEQSRPSGAQPLVMHFLSWDQLRQAAGRG